MGKEDYATAGGALKLKGASKPVGIIKKKKKKSSKPKPSDPTSDSDNKAKSRLPTEEGEKKEGKGGEEGEEEEGTDTFVEYKTEAERRFEERRRKMMDEKLKKEGVKTHKERVEEYNKYLASLSEHHDMPRIGPG